MNLFPQYIHIVNPKLKHTYLSFDDMGNLIIKSPKVSQKYIEKLLLKKSTWIKSSRIQLEKKKGKALNFSSFMEIYFMGESHPLILELWGEKRPQLVFEEGQFTLYYSVYDETIFQIHIDRFYKKEAQTYIPLFVSYWAEKMQLFPSKIRFRKTKRQWGSCSGKNVLSFNTMMMKLPKDVIQYVIVHELAHIQHKHHQKTFWALVEKYLPNCKTHIAELKHYTT
jgi:predicted metal-dependent hydrolase